MITPTIGRVVWFWPFISDPEDSAQEQPNAAIIVYVWNSRLVNLVVFDENGLPHGETSVPLLQDDDPLPSHGRVAQWMPYQKGQAAKTEALERSSGLIYPAQ